jgi:hypothetical protein
VQFRDAADANVGVSPDQAGLAADLLAASHPVTCPPATTGFPRRN